MARARDESAGLMRQEPSHPPMTPLTGAARLVRGFRRVGIVIAILAGIAGMSVTCFIAFDSARSAVSRIEQEQCIRAKYVRDETLASKWNDPKSVDLRDSGCGGPALYITYDVLRRLPRASPPAFVSEFLPAFGIGTLITCAIAILLFLSCLTMGWVAAGFTRY
jgi:hypothetical protein